MISLEDIIDKKLFQIKKNKIWLANELDISKQLLNHKIKNNSFSAIQLIQLGKLLDIDLNKLKIDEENEAKDLYNKLQFISDLVLKGCTSGVSPDWDIEGNIEFEYLEQISLCIKNGAIKGIYPVKWELIIE